MNSDSILSLMIASHHVLLERYLVNDYFFATSTCFLAVPVQMNHVEFSDSEIAANSSRVITRD